MGGIVEAALMRERGDRNLGQRCLSQQVFEPFDSQPQDMALECRVAVGEDAVKGPF